MSCVPPTAGHPHKMMKVWVSQDSDGKAKAHTSCLITELHVGRKPVRDSAELKG